MKKIIILSILFMSTFTFAQLADCKDLPNPKFPQPSSSIYSRSILTPPPTSNKYVFNIKFHIVKNTDGSGSTSLFGENEVMNAIMILNTTYNQYNIFFKYIGYDVIKNSLYMKLNSQTGVSSISTTQPTFTDLINYSKTGMSNPVYDFNAMNIFIIDKLDENINTLVAQTAGVAYRPGVDCAFTSNYFLTSSLPHEIAHNFNLKHTHDGSVNYINGVMTPLSTGERVSGINSSTSGDFVIDTPASHPLNYQVSNVNYTNCSYLNPNSFSDFTGAVYTNVPVKNFMSTNNNCRQLGAGYLPGNAVFTNGQANLMREQIETFCNNSSNIYGYYNAKNTVESLYEPFATTGMSGSSTSSSSTAYSRTATVKTDGSGVDFLHTPVGITLRFQKGFGYEFSYYNSGVIYKAVTDQYNFPYGSLFLGVKIPILDQTIYQVGGYQSFTTFEPFISGNVRSTTNIGMASYTQEQLDLIKVSDPNLYDQLQSQKYHIITKETESGYIDQKVIYKN